MPVIKVWPAIFLCINSTQENRHDKKGSKTD